MNEKTQGAGYSLTNQIIPPRGTNYIYHNYWTPFPLIFCSLDILLCIMQPGEGAMRLPLCCLLREVKYMWKTRCVYVYYDTQSLLKLITGNHPLVFNLAI